MENLINLTATLTALLVTSCIIGKIVDIVIKKKADKASYKEFMKDAYVNIYVINTCNKEAFLNYFSFVKEESSYEEQCYGFKVVFSDWGDDTHTPAQFLESWLTDPTF